MLIKNETKPTPYFVDYRQLNVIVKQHLYFIFGIDEYVYLPGKETLFSALKADSSYWQIKIEDAEKIKNSFTLHHCLYLFIQKLFGRSNAPSTFQRTIDVILLSIECQLPLFI